MREYRHYDFQRIYNEFVKYYNGREIGESEYYTWLGALGLNEEREYGAASESFKWAKDMLQFIKEDSNNKYYQVLVGFPLKSMNGNVYREADLMKAAETLKGKHPSLNHKDEFWFSPDNPRNRWGTLTVEAAKYEDGAIEAILKVPKEAVCPICNGKKMTELIDAKKIVNVSLEGECMGGFCSTTGECNEFCFNDKGFTLLTTDVLPGIPLARIKPLESIMVEALRNTSQKNKIKEKKNTVKIKPKIIETTVNTTSIKDNNDFETDTFRGTWGTTLTSDKQIYDGDQHHNAVTVSGPDPSPNPFTSGSPMDDVTPDIPRRAEAQEPTFVDHQGPYSTTDGPSGNTSMPKPEDIKSGPPKTKPAPSPDYPLSGQPEGAPTTFPPIEKPETDTGEQPPKADDKVVTGDTPAKEEMDCGDGMHWNAEQGKCVSDSTQEEACPDGYHKGQDGICEPDEPLDEQVKRFKAETKTYIALAETNKMRERLKTIENYWINKYTKLNEQYTKALSFNKLQDKLNKQTREQVRAEQLRCEDLRVEIRELKNQMADQVTVNNKQNHLVEDLKIDNAELNKKYNGALSTNLQLSKKITQANEDYLDIAKAKEHLEEELKKAKVFAKKTLKLKV